MSIPRPEHPFPHFERKNWLNLNGTWQFEMDPGCSGRARGMTDPDYQLNDTITLPFCPESKLSGVQYTDFMPCVWYRRSVTVPESFLGQRVFFHIGACDWLTEVFVNGVSVGSHRGGYTPICFEITHALAEGENVLTVCAQDDTRSANQPAGKQSSEYASFGCMYTRTTGIWQTVWLEARPQSYLEDCAVVTHMDGTVALTVRAAHAEGLQVSAAASLQEEPVAVAAGTVHGGVAKLQLSVPEVQLWSPKTPVLYDLTLTLDQPSDEPADQVKSYFGVREFWYADHRLYLNGKSIFGRFILDQGFYRDGIYTAPSEDALISDIIRSMDCGFNGARLHQKVFEPRFLYHCDRLGYLVWDEHANWGLDVSRPQSWGAFIPEWQEIVLRDRSHPAVIGWCPFNETQPNADPALLAQVYRLTKALDPTRPVIDSSGWVHVPGCCDMPDWHDYDQNPETFRARYEALYHGNTVVDEKVPPFAPPEELCFVSEFGGTRWSGQEAACKANEIGAGGSWGYGVAPTAEKEFLDRYKGLVDALLDNSRICAFCYTQLTDVEQEQNGLYTYDRIPKFDPEILYEITSRKAAVED